MAKSHLDWKQIAHAALFAMLCCIELLSVFRQLHCYFDLRFDLFFNTTGFQLTMSPTLMCISGDMSILTPQNVIASFFS